MSYFTSEIRKAKLLPEYSEDELLCDGMTHQKQFYKTYKILLQV